MPLHRRQCSTDFVMRGVLTFRSRAKGTFALRIELEAAKGLVCDLRRNPDNGHGATLPKNTTQSKINFMR